MDECKPLVNGEHRALGELALRLQSRGVLLVGPLHISLATSDTSRTLVSTFNGS